MRTFLTFNYLSVCKWHAWTHLECEMSDNLKGGCTDTSEARSPEKSSCSFGFCPNYLDPTPLPNLDNLYHFFWTPMCQTIWAGVSPSLPIPKLTQYMQFGKSGKRFWTGPSPPPSFGQNSKERLFFFRKPSLTNLYRFATIILYIGLAPPLHFFNNTKQR